MNYTTLDYSFDHEFRSMMEQHNVTHVAIFGHENPDGDAAGSVLGLAHYLHAVYPEYTIAPYLEESMDPGPKKTVLTDPLFQPFQLPSFLTDGTPYLAISCDTATRKRMIGYSYYEKAVYRLAIDHHASNEMHGDTNVVVISEACAANVFSLLDWSLWESTPDAVCHPNAADYLYLGILTDTSGFERSDPFIFQAALRLQELGVNHFKAEKVLHTETLDEYMTRSQILSNTKRALDGKVAYIIADKKMQQELNFDYLLFRPLAALLRNCADIELGITFFQADDTTWWGSLRSNVEWINVNHLANCFGGGGHAAASGMNLYDQTPEEVFPLIFEKVQELRCSPSPSPSRSRS